VIPTCLLLLGLLAHAAEPEVDPRPDPAQAWDLLLDLPPDTRQAVVQRLLDQGHIEPPLLRAGHQADQRALAQTVEQRLATGRTALRAGRPDGALLALGPVRDDPRVRPFWVEAVDAHVYARREVAGRWYRRAGQLRGESRQHALLQARSILAELAHDFPDSIYAEPVLDALARVDRTLDAHDRRVQAQAHTP